MVGSNSEINTQNNPTLSAISDEFSNTNFYLKFY